MKCILFLFFLFFCLTGRTGAQETVGTVVFRNIDIREDDELLHVRITADLERINLRKQDLLFLTPVLQENNGNRKIELGLLAVAGKVRHKIVKRSIRLEHYGYDAVPDQFALRENGTAQSLEFACQIPFEEWMRNASLTFTQVVTGCRDCPPCFADYKIELDLPAPFEPVFRVAYVTPQAEPVKRRSESYQAHLNYVVDKYDLHRDFAGNAAVLDEVDRVVREIAGDEALTIETLKVTGYASPEGNYNRNMILSKNRAYAFVSYLSHRHNLPESMIAVDWKGEDWEGLRQAVSQSRLEERDALLDILDRNTDVAARKRELMAYKGGTVYRNLLQNYYPPLRRNDYMINFVARPFDIEEAKMLIRTKPHYLSLNEMFLVANSYPKDSPEFKEVFDIAVRMFPEDETARVNSAAQEVESGLYAQALRRLENIRTAEAWNNAAVAYALQGESQKAQEYFTKALNAGSSVAAENLRQLLKASETKK